MELISTKICKTSDIGVNDNLFGGAMLSWLDEAGGVFAAVKSGCTNMITLRFSEVIFRKPVKVKEHIRIYGQVVKVGTTSLTIIVEARRISFRDNTEEQVCSTHMTFVRIDELGNAVPIDSGARKRIEKQLNGK